MFFNKKELMPERVKLGVCSICNLNCRDCYMRKSKTNFGNVGAGYLKYENFVKFLDMNPFVREIELANHGEAFLNPDLVKILETACRRNIIVTFNNGVNFNRVSDAQMEALVKYSVKGITVAIDGGSSDVYVKYRRGGNFDTVINNIKKLNEYKKKYGTEFPTLQWQYVVMDTNDSKEEVDKAVKLANDLNMTIFFIRTWNLDYKPKDPDFVNSLLIDVRDEFKNYKNLKKKEPLCSICTDLWEAPQINWDGRFLACCCNYENPFGINVFETGLVKCLKSRMVRKTKKMLMGGRSYKKSPCYNCYFYKKVMKEKYISKK